MLVFFSNLHFQLLIPPPYSNRSILMEVPSLEKVFSDNPIKFLKQYWHTDCHLLLELYLRGFILETNERDSYMHWEYIFINKNDQRKTISQSICKYLFRKHPIYKLLDNQPNSFFKYVPLQQLHKLMKSIDYDILKTIISKDAFVLSSLELPHQALIQKTFLRDNYFNLKLPSQTLQFLFSHGIFYYEDLVLLDKAFLHNLPKLGPVKLSSFAQQYQIVFNCSLRIS